MSSVFYLLMNRIFATQSLYQENQGYQWLKFTFGFRQIRKIRRQLIDRVVGRALMEGVLTKVNLKNIAL